MLLIPALSQAQLGYIVLQTGDSLAGPVLYHDAQGALHMIGGEQVQTISTSTVTRFGIFDTRINRYRRFERIDKLDSLAPDGLARSRSKLVFCEVLPLATGGKLLCRSPYTFKNASAPTLSSTIEDGKPSHLSLIERKLRRIARRNTRRFAEAEPIYYIEHDDRIQCVSPVRRFWRLRYRTQDVDALLRETDPSNNGMQAWVQRFGNPLGHKRRMEDFVQAFCVLEHKDYAYARP